MVAYIHDSYQQFKETGKKKSVPFWKRLLILSRDASKPAWPMLLFIVFYMICFDKLEHMHVLHYTVIHLRVDDLIPFCEVFIIPYLLWFPYMIVNEVYFYTFDEYTYHRTARMLAAGMTVFLAVSYLFPNIQHLRPAVMPRDNIFTRMVSGLYRIDTPTNILPSIHVYNTLVLMTGVRKCSHFFIREKTGIRWFQYILGVLIILSTMLIKQHSVFDVLCAFGMAFIAYVIAYQPGLVADTQRRKNTVTN